MWAPLIGGIGVFLLGMGLMTDGLKQWAGDGMKRFLERFAGNRWSAAATGAGATILIQSSSATSLITIGLVSAGLVTLANAIAILIGANVGTTATGYLVAFIGLKLSVSSYALPLIGFGALAKLFVHGRWGAIASAVTGFGLLFLGIDMMRGAIGHMAEGFDLGAWAGTGWLGAVVLILIGVIMTVMVQSSSAAMATTLTTLDAGAIGLKDAAFLVIGQNIGTTVTAQIGALGGSIAAKRTAASHLVFNVGTALPAIVLIAPLLAAATKMASGDAVVTLALFHTAFNVLGLAIFLPLVGVLAARLELWLPEPANPLTGSLDRAALQTAGSSEAATTAAIRGIHAEMVHLVRSRIANTRRPKDWARRKAALRDAIDDTRRFMDRARDMGYVSRHMAEQLEALDHLHHMALDLEEGPAVAVPEVREDLRAYLIGFEAALAAGEDQDRRFAELKELRKRMRQALLERVEKEATLTPGDGALRLESLHWLDRMSVHLRIVARLERADFHYENMEPEWRRYAPSRASAA